MRLRCYGVEVGGKLDVEALFVNRSDADWHVHRYGGKVVLVWGEVDTVELTNRRPTVSFERRYSWGAHAR